MNKKNIIIFINAFWNYEKEISGSEQVLIQVFKKIRGSFNGFDCYTSFDGKKIIEKDVKAVKFHLSSKFFDRFPLIISYFLRTLQSLKVIFKRNIDIVYSGSDFFPDTIPGFLYKIFYPKTKWIQCVFHIYPDWRRRPGNKIKNLVAQYLQKFSFILAKKADIIININNQVKEELIKFGLDENKIVVNTPGIDLDYFQNLKVNENTKKYQASFLARLNPSKGIFDLIKIWKRVVKELPNAKLAVIGGGSEEIKNKLKKEIKKESLEKNIDILGFLENDRAFSTLKNSKVFLFPSHEEGFAIAIAEAMACRVPVVSWNLPVYKEIFEDNCIQIEENNIELFAEKVLDLMKNDINREKIIDKAEKFINRYSWDSVVQKHLKILLNKNNGY